MRGQIDVGGGHKLNLLCVHQNLHGGRGRSVDTAKRASRGTPSVSLMLATKLTGGKGFPGRGGKPVICL